MRTKKVLAVLLCVMMVLSLAACGKKEEKKPSDATDKNQEEQKESGEENSGKQDETQDETGKDNASQGDTQTGDDTEQKDNAEADPDKPELPLCETKEELSFWIPWTFAYLDSIDEVKNIQELEERTNVHINWVTPASQEANEKFGLMLASGDYPDILRGVNQYYPGGIEKGVEDGILLDMTDLIEQYMPHYQAIRTSVPEVEKATKTDAGRTPVIWTIASDDEEVSMEMVWAGLFVRKDWLDELKMDLPETIQDWHDMLKAFKDNYNCEAPLVFAADGTFLQGEFVSAYGVLPEFYLDGTTIKYGPAEPGYRQYVETMRDWYAEGLIDPNFQTNDGTLVADNSYMATGKSGAGCSAWGYSNDLLRTDYGMTDEEDFWLEGVPNPVLNEGDTPQTGSTMCGYVKEALAVTTNCKNPELAARWLDYFYTKDGMLLNAYGMEGETYEILPDGTPQYTELITKNPDGYGMSDAFKIYTLDNSSFGLYSWARYFHTGRESYTRSMDCQYTWNEAKTDMVIPTAVSMTDEEINAYNTAYTAIQTLVNEKTVKYIMGTEDMSTYDAFIQSLYDYGIEDCIQYKQTAYDRYLAR